MVKIRDPSILFHSAVLPKSVGCVDVIARVEESAVDIPLMPETVILVADPDW